MNRIVLLLTIFVSSFSLSVSSQVLMPIPAHLSVYTGYVRGYWFTAPCPFTIVGLKVSPEAGTGVQYIHVMKILDATPVVFSTTSTNFTTLTFINGAPNNVTQTVSIPVNTGDIIGILGSVGTGACSYSPSAAPFATTINGFPVNLNRLLYQGNMTAPVPNYSTEVGFNIGRVEMTYTVGPPPAPICLVSPIAPVNNSTTVCAGSTVLRWNKATGATGYDVYLDAGTATPTTIVSTNQPDTFYNATTAVGPYRWKIVPRNTSGQPTGCPTWSFQAVPSTVATASVTVNPGANICPMTVTTFTAAITNGGTAPSFQWKKNNINVGTNAAVYVDGGLITGDKVKVVMTSNATGCLSAPNVTSNEITMNVLQAPTANIAASGPKAFCNGGLVTLTTTSVGTTYQWLYNNAVIAGATGMTYNAAYSGFYKVRVTGSTNCPATSDSIVVTVYATPFPLVNRVGLELSTSPFYATYQWYFNNQPIPGATTYTHTITRDGRYVVKVTDTSGCNGASIVTPVNSLNVSGVTPSDISVYPNPANNIVSINGPVKMNIELYSLDGKKIMDKQQATSISVGHLSDGIYMLHIYDEQNNFIKVEKLVKRGN